MKLSKLFIYIAITFIVFWLPLAYIAYGAEQQTTITWTIQPESPAPTHFQIYQADNHDMTGATSQGLQPETLNPYSAPLAISVPNNAVTTIYFAMTACNANGCSGYSNIVRKEFDTRVDTGGVPLAPAQVEIIVNVSIRVVP